MYPKWEFSHITLPVRNLLDLKIFYRDLLKPSISIPEWNLQCKKILLQKHSPLCQYVLRKGQTPTPLRGELWSYVLGSHNFRNVIIFIFSFFFEKFDQLKCTFTFKHLSHWEKLKNDVLTTDLIVDKLVFKDVQLTATNDDQYFVFEDILYQVQSRPIITSFILFNFSSAGYFMLLTRHRDQSIYPIGSC